MDGQSNQSGHSKAMVRVTGRSHFLHLDKPYHFLHLVFLILKRSDFNWKFWFFLNIFKSGKIGIWSNVLSKYRFLHLQIGTHGMSSDQRSSFEYFFSFENEFETNWSPGEYWLNSDFNPRKSKRSKCRQSD